ncbi:MAG: HEPN domain-containing protein [Bacillota bacterium]
MKPSESASYRLRLAQGFLDEARQDASTGRWRSCVDNAQLAAEHALKAVVALWGPVSKTHRPAAKLMEMLDQRQIPQEFRAEVDRLVDAAEFLGPEIHVRTDYGDEAGGLTPWEIFKQGDARDALDVAENVVHLATQIVRRVTS